MSDLRFCPKCGTKIETGEKFCGNCGFDTEAVADFEETIQPEDQVKFVGTPANPRFVDAGPIPESTPQNQGQKQSSRMPIIIISIVLGAIILIGGTAFWWFSQGQHLFGKAGSSVGSQTNGAVLDLPTYSLSEGSYSTEQQVAISNPAGEEVQVYYTIDGTDPTVKSAKYENPIVLQTNTTLKSIAIDKNGNQSDIKTATYNIAITQPATTQPQTTQPQTTTTTPAASTNANERAQFESNIAGTWKVRDSSGFVLYYTFSGGRVNVTDGGSDYFDDVYSFNISPGNNGTIGTVDAGTHSFSIDCNPLGDNAIYINGLYASYY
ncbi:chitobiase/beta-hexosaminidase C-terminal domain-containing protein [Acetobacterium sp.]|uniref:chitobiase/beta-hexosaminidase C-terminal domain-containing protein n=1 Tax=Acetobacterium sp. TaxID=1872094 RepID=UPI003593AA58